VGKTTSQRRFRVTFEPSGQAAVAGDAVVYVPPKKELQEIVVGTQASVLER
jgi:hypothetical protein